jgi:phage FluMu protein Com
MVDASSNLLGRGPVEQTRSRTASLLDERCLCGSLVAKLSPKGVEILCRRCKRIHVIPWADEREAATAASRQHVA